MEKINKKEIALKISSRLEYLISTKKIKNEEISSFIDMGVVNFSKNRCLLKKGKIPSSNFLLGITIYFKENFFEF